MSDCNPEEPKVEGPKPPKREGVASPVERSISYTRGLAMREYIRGADENPENVFNVFEDVVERKSVGPVAHGDVLDLASVDFFETVTLDSYTAAGGIFGPGGSSLTFVQGWFSEDYAQANFEDSPGKSNGVVEVATMGLAQIAVDFADFVGHKYFEEKLADKVVKANRQIYKNLCGHITRNLQLMTLVQVSQFTDQKLLASLEPIYAFASTSFGADRLFFIRHAYRRFFADQVLLESGFEGRKYYCDGIVGALRDVPGETQDQKKVRGNKMRKRHNQCMESTIVAVNLLNPKMPDHVRAEALFQDSFALHTYSRGLILMTRSIINDVSKDMTKKFDAYGCEGLTYYWQHKFITQIEFDAAVASGLGNSRKTCKVGFLLFGGAYLYHKLGSEKVLPKADYVKSVIAVYKKYAELAGISSIFVTNNENLLNLHAHEIGVRLRQATSYIDKMGGKSITALREAALAITDAKGRDGKPTFFAYDFIEAVYFPLVRAFAAKIEADQTCLHATAIKSFLPKIHNDILMGRLRFLGHVLMNTKAVEGTDIEITGNPYWPNFVPNVQRGRTELRTLLGSLTRVEVGGDLPAADTQLETEDYTFLNAYCETLETPAGLGFEYTDRCKDAVKRYRSPLSSSYEPFFGDLFAHIYPRNQGEPDERVYSYLLRMFASKFPRKKGVNLAKSRARFCVAEYVHEARPKPEFLMCSRFAIMFKYADQDWAFCWAECYRRRDKTRRGKCISHCKDVLQIAKEGTPEAKKVAFCNSALLRKATKREECIVAAEDATIGAVKFCTTVRPFMTMTFVTPLAKKQDLAALCLAAVGGVLVVGNVDEIARG